MKDIAWSQLLSVDIDEIDDDHRKLLEIFNHFHHALKDGESPDYLAAVLEELINCTAWHFSHEERLMLKYDYKEIEEHKAAHQELIKSAKDFQHRFLQAENSITGADIEFLERWLTEHILTDDMRLGAYLFQVM